MSYVIRKMRLPHGIAIFHDASDESQQDQRLRYQPQPEGEGVKESL